jgi:UDP-N-acetylglucosamine--N-acetylmuramyl-(pentapeptide) pyrophosphoryl-undecaprenol N-acetylglucosamine transferase
MPKRVKDNGVDYETIPSLDIREYIYNMPTVLAAADVIIGRAGSATCNEIAASGTPCILIPSPNVTDNHQEKNALALANQGGAVMIRESECTPQRLFDEISALLADKTRYNKMRQAQQNMVILDSAERLCSIILQMGKAGK